MTWNVGEQYPTANGGTASIKWAVGQWIGGFVVMGQGAPLALRWNGNTGVSDQGAAFALIQPGGSVWGVFFRLSSGKVSSAVKDTEQEATDFGNSHGNTHILTVEVPL